MFEEKTGPRHIYTVSQLTRDIKLILENTFPEVWIEGEVSNFRQFSSGHSYFSLKDSAAVLQAVIFNRAAKEVKFKPEDGLKVVCFGRVELYEPRGQYQLIIEKIEPKGIGSLQLALEQLKTKLEKEGLFALEHKRAIPYLPGRIGVVTSLSGAAVKDILKVLDRRFRDIHIIIYPVRVQGEEAKTEIAQAIADLNRLNVDSAAKERIEVMIVGRGGGSIEDLWAFNEEAVARAIYNSKIPVISAVGHERDWTIADLVADMRAATPSVAAELVIPRKEDLKEKVNGLFCGLNRAFADIASGLTDVKEGLTRRLVLCAQHSLELNTRELDSARKKLSLLNPTILIQQHLAKITDITRQISFRFGQFLKLKQAEFHVAIEKLSSLSPLNILARGYSITFKMPQGQAVKDFNSVRPGDMIKTRLHKGEIISKITGVENGGY